MADFTTAFSEKQINKASLGHINYILHNLNLPPVTSKNDGVNQLLPYYTSGDKKVAVPDTLTKPVTLTDANVLAVVLIQKIIRDIHTRKIRACIVIQTRVRVYKCKKWFSNDRKTLLRNARDIFDKVKYVYKNLGPHDAESHYQTVLHRELEPLYTRGTIQREVITPLHYTASDGNIYQLDNSINVRIDLKIIDVAKEFKCVLELKALDKLHPKCFYQLRRYLLELNPSTGGNYKGMLINFGNTSCNVVIYQDSANHKLMNMFEYSISWEALNK